jgi:hypothetical protein
MGYDDASPDDASCRLDLSHNRLNQSDGDVQERDVQERDGDGVQEPSMLAFYVRRGADVLELRAWLCAECGAED